MKCICEHMCTGNCRRVGCNCECGEFHCNQEDEAQIIENHSEE